MKKVALIVAIGLGVAVTLLAGQFAFGPELDCQENPNLVFTHDITDIEKIEFIVPPGNVEDYAGGESVFKTHSYIRGPNRMPIYAPVDGQLYEGIYVWEGGRGQYALFFNVSCEIFYLFDHVVDPVDKVARAFPDLKQHTNEREPLGEPIDFKAGELVGYSIGADFPQWDFGVYDRTQERKFGEIQGQAKVFGRDMMARCPYDFFPPEKRNFYYSKFGSHVDKPIPNFICYE